MKNLRGVIGLVLALYVALLMTSPRARSLDNHQDIAQKIGNQGILALGAGLLILAGGIDLSIGSVFGLAAVCFPLLVRDGIHPWIAAVLVIWGASMLGVGHGVLVTKLQLQPFLVTLCGLLIYRGLARWATWTPGGSSQNVGTADLDLAGLKFLGGADPVLGVPMSMWVMVVVAVLFAVLLHATVYGRYLYAIGANEQAARYAGVPTDRYRIAAYMVCSLTAGLGGLLSIIEVGGANPSDVGDKEELYAITAAVLGGCSLRGGEGTVLGMLLGAVALRLMYSFVQWARIPMDLFPTVVGLALLLGTVADEVLKRRAARQLK
jgi:ribose transport system permease protein